MMRLKVLVNRLRPEGAADGNKQMAEKLLIIGLGNPGRKYQLNRHNVGFQIVDALAARLGIEFSRQQSNALIATGQIGSMSVVLAKPQTYMNRSGGPTSALLRFYKIPIENLLVVCDDLDLPLGTLRFRPQGSSGGQNGIKDVIEKLGSQEFVRLRVGIDRPQGRMDPVAYVLQDFSGTQMEIIEETYGRAADAIETWARDGITLAMSRHNGPAPTEDKAPAQGGK